jgi:hypothetical protein
MLFFKYMTSAVARTVLQNATLRWSTPETLNDPFDIQFDLQIAVDPKKVKRLALDKIWNALQGETRFKAGNILGALLLLARSKSLPGESRFNSKNEFDEYFGPLIEEGIARGSARNAITKIEVRQMMSDVKILCVTKSPKITPMWSHYAEHHKGIVLGFRHIEQLDTIWSQARPVQYVQKMPLLFDDVGLAELMAGSIGIEPSVVLNKLIFTKSSDWSYEQEWRINFGSGRNKLAKFEDLPFHHLELAQVVLGCRIEDDTKQEIISLVKRLYPHAAIFTAAKSVTDFTLDLQPVTTELASS